VAEASRIFGEMSDRRYGFTANFQIFDSLTNEERVPQTLSGGEKFQASLALSLAVVEIAANAGATIGCLFLDEGFATLNAELVEIAMLSLRRRARQGRSIYVISHLREVTQFVDSTFHIEATEDGSDYRVFHGAI
jgi:exonuclease SbcC